VDAELARERGQGNVVQQGFPFNFFLRSIPSIVDRFKSGFKPDGMNQLVGRDAHIARMERNFDTKYSLSISLLRQ
jgi:hypothetical protein